MVGTSGIEPPTTTMSRWCSTTELRAYYSIYRKNWLELYNKLLACGKYFYGKSGNYLTFQRNFTTTNSYLQKV
ncbi:hypothetical protein Lisr_2466 [Legionella israelensis]|uniref:Uncharacterized protein n=1 Tax=Legionella israelensis TaxID=454 RepID=A0A0W0V2B6_9GAMM|nr:hypothetical protein Lisr_2466 [Legionella israelensis]